MLDLSHLVGNSRADVQVFTGFSELSRPTWQQWQKPRGVSMSYILAIGTGGDGGNGSVGAAGSSAGGGGGGSGGQSTLLLPTFLLPDILYISLAVPGSSNASFISIAPENFSTVLRVLAGGQGGNASGTTGGTAGAAGGSTTTTTSPLAGLGRYNFRGGQAGAVGRNGGNPIASDVLDPTNGLIVMGGGGGGSTQAAGVGSGGGSLRYPNGVYVNINGGQSVGGSGGPGLSFSPPSYPLLFSGGGGGASGESGTNGGGGGAGAYGCGGGGGGGAVTGDSAGVGGRGGPALVVIISW